MKNLEIGKTYRKSNGSEEMVAGFTREYPEWVWTTQGNWYRQNDGRYITVNKDGKTTPMKIPTYRDLIP